MILESLQQQKKLTPEELSKAEEEYRDLDPKGEAELWDGLHYYFLRASVTADRVWWLSYFRWYTELTWRFLPQRSDEVVSAVAYARQLVMAVLLDFDPVTELIMYINEKPWDEEGVARFYTRVRDGVMKSSAIVGVSKGREITLADLFRELSLIKQANDTLRMAEFITRLRDVLFPKTDTLLDEYVPMEAERGANVLTDVMLFFLEVVPESFYAVMQTSLHPEYYETGAAEGESASPAEEAEADLSSEPAEESIEGAESVAPAQSEEAGIDESAATPNVSEETPRAPSRPTNTELRAMVEALIPADLPPEEQAPRIVEMLSDLADRYHDETIRDVYYFDETTGRFEWLP